MAALSEVFAEFKTRFDTRALEQGEKQTNRVTDGLKKLGAIVAGGALVSGIKRLGSEFITTLDEIDKTSRAIGINAEALQELRFAGEQSGVQTEKLNMALGLLQQRALDASRGSKEAALNFDELGVAVTTSDGSLRSVDAILADVSDGFARTDNAVQKTGIAMKLFGESGKTLVPLLNQGSAGIATLRQEAQDLGGVFSQDMVDSGARANDALNRIRLAFRGVFGTLAVQALPAIEKLSALIVAGVKRFREWTDGINFGRLGLVALTLAAGPLALTLLPKLAAGVALVGKQMFQFVKNNPMLVALTAAVVVVEDLMTAFDGGKSAIREFLLPWFDVNKVLDVVVSTFKTFVAFLKGTFLDVVNSAKNAVGGLANAVGAAAGFLGFDETAKNARSFAKRTGGNRLGNADRLAAQAEQRFNREEGARLLERIKTQSASGATVQQLSASQAQAVAQAAGRSKGALNQQIAATINVSGAQNPQAVAQAVKQVIDRELRKAAEDAE